MKLIIKRSQTEYILPHQPASAIANKLVNIHSAAFSKPVQPVKFLLSLKLEVSEEEAQVIKKYNKENYSFGGDSTIVNRLEKTKNRGFESGGIFFALSSTRQEINTLIEKWRGYNLSNLIKGIELEFNNVRDARLAEELIKADCQAFKDEVWSAVSFDGTEELEF